MTKHEWFDVCFNYAGWIECTCGFRPESEEEFNKHAREYEIEN